MIILGNPICLASHLVKLASAVAGGSSEVVMTLTLSVVNAEATVGASQSSE